MNFRSLITPLCVSFVFATILADAQNPAAQNPASPTPPLSQPPSSPTIFNTQSTLVLVPALVRTHSGTLIYALKADDFTLTDNGVPQKLSLEDATDTEPLALVIAVETSGAGAQQISSMKNLAPYLQALIGSVRHRVAVVTFDSKPQLQQNFTDKMEKIDAAMHDLTPGDNGAAILDAVNYSVDLLRTQPPEFRRAILLISETIDRGSHIQLGDALHSISDTNTTIYSLAYSSSSSDVAHYANQNIPSQCHFAGLGIACANPNTQNPGGCMGKDPNAKPGTSQNKASQALDCLGQLAPPVAILKMAVIAAIDSMHRNTPEAVAHLTGGEYYKIESEKNITEDLMTLSNHVPNRYVLSFIPTSPTPGPHVIRLSLKNYPNLTVSARTSYWIDDDTPAPTTTPKK